MAALLPVNANEADLAPSFACSVAQCIATRAQAEDMLRLLRQHAGDIRLVIHLNAQYGSMVRASLSVHARLIRMQALGQNRRAASHELARPACPGVTRVEPPAASPEAAPAAYVDQTTDAHVS